MSKEMFQRFNQIKDKQEIIKEIEEKKRIIKDLDNDCTEYSLHQYYTGYLRAYADCIQLITEKL